jgi:hypothetical protein
MKKLKPLPVPIPLDLADEIGVDASFISHVNAGRKRLPIERCNKVMKLSLVDSRLTGIHFLHLRPELEKSQNYICAPEHSKRRKGRAK